MAWDDTKEQELKATQDRIKELTKAKLEKMNVSPWRAGLEAVFGPGFQSQVGGAPTEDRPRDIRTRVDEAIPATTSMVGADVGENIGGTIGETAGSLVPGPLKVPAMVVGRKGGQIVGRIGGSYAGGYTGRVAEDAVTTFDSPESIDDWFMQLHERGKVEGQEQARGEALSIPLGGALRTGVRVLKGLGDAKIDLNASSIAAWMHSNFKRSYDLAAQGVRDQIIRDPAMAERMIANQGLTRSEKLNNNFYNLMNGIASGSYWGGGRMRKAGESRDDLFRLTARQFGEDVGEQIDPSDLANLIDEHVTKEFKVEGRLKIPMLSNLEAKAAGATVDTRSMKWDQPGRAFGFMRDFKDTDSITVRQYRQLRDANDKLITDFRQSPEIKAQAQRNITSLDARARRGLPPDALDALKDVQSWERDYNKKYGDKFIEGILSHGKNARSFVDGLVNKPDYRRIEKIMNVITDDTVKGNIRRALLDRTLDRAMLPSGDMSGDAFRKTVNVTVGEKPLKRILGNDMAKNVDKFVAAREYLQNVSKRGESGRVAIALQQSGILYAIPAFLAGSGQYSPAAASAVGLLTLPRVAAQFLTGPGGGPYAKFVQALGSPRVPRDKITRMAKQTLSQVMDHRIAERIAGRWFTGESLSPEEVSALNGAANPEEAPGPAPSASGPNYPESVGIGR